MIKFLQIKGMTPTQIHQDIVATIGESAVSYDIVKRWCREFKCGRTSCEDQHAGGPPVTVTTDKNIKKIHDLVLQDRRLRIRDIGAETGLSYCVVQNILTKELDMKKVSARWVPRMLTNDQKRHRVLICERLLAMYQRNKANFLQRVLHYDPGKKLK